MPCGYAVGKTLKAAFQVNLCSSKAGIYLIKKLPVGSGSSIPVKLVSVKAIEGIFCYNLGMEDCLFCKIIKEEIPSEQILETSNYVAFKDIHPKAPVHVLIVPKRHVEKPEELRPEEISDMLNGSEEIAQILGVKDSGYRLLFNVGKHAGQEVDHVHMHLIGGTPSKGMY